jgi:hypothetical protein
VALWKTIQRQLDNPSWLWALRIGNFVVDRDGVQVTIIFGLDHLIKSERILLHDARDFGCDCFMTVEKKLPKAPSRLSIGPGCE